jgi:hypothetical protein
MLDLAQMTAQSKAAAVQVHGGAAREIEGAKLERQRECPQANSLFDHLIREGVDECVQFHGALVPLAAI